MLPTVALLFSIGAQAAPKASPTILPTNNPLVAEARRRGVDVFAFIPKGHDLRQLPATANRLETWTMVDQRSRLGAREFFTRNAGDMFPQNLLSLESRQFGILRNARNMLLNLPQKQPNYAFSGYTSLAETPKSAQGAILDTIFTGYESIPTESAKGEIGLNIIPNYQFVDPRTNQQKSYSLDRLPKPSPNQPVPTLPKSTELEDLRTRTLTQVGKKFPAKTIDLAPGVYSAKTLFDRATEGVQDQFLLDKRFHDFQVLVVPTKPMSSFDLLSGIARTLDLYPRRFPSGWLLAISPEDPHEFFNRKRAIEGRNLGLDILRKLYELGRIPSYVPPETFYVPGSELPPASRDRLLSDLSGGASNGFSKEEPGVVQALRTPGRYGIRCYLSIGLILNNNSSTTEAHAFFP